MILTQLGLVRSLVRHSSTTANQEMLGSPLPPPSKLSYSHAGIFTVIACSLTLAIVGVIVCITQRDHLFMLWSGVTIQIIGVYLVATSVREWRSLDLITKHFEGLSDSAKSEIIDKLLDTKPQQGVLEIIETLLNRIFGDR